jgi:ribonuclease HI
VKAEQFHSIIAKVQYLAVKTRPDLLPAVSFLLSRVTKWTDEDWEKLRRLISYISCTKGYGLHYHRGKSVMPRAYVDASHGTHPEDGTSRTGVVLTVAGGAVCFKSCRQSIVTLSSTEAELVALTEGMNHVQWLRYFLGDLSVKVDGPTIVYQDNTSTIGLITNEKTKQQRTKHLNCKYFAIREHIKDKSIALEHLAGTEMLADVLTKSVDGSTLKRLLPGMMRIADK